MSAAVQTYLPPGTDAREIGKVKRSRGERGQGEILRAFCAEARNRRCDWRACRRGSGLGGGVISLAETHPSRAQARAAILEVVGHADTL